MSFNDDDAVARELIQTTENDGDLYRQITQSILRNLATKKAEGKYDGEKAIQAFMYLAEAGARAYARTHGSSEMEWHDIFPVAVRRAAATHWRNEFEGEFDLGNYEDLLPKKYQKTSKTPGTAGGRKTKQHHAYNIGDEVWWWKSSGVSSSKVVGTVQRIHFLGEEPNYQVKIHGAGPWDDVVLKAQHELASETGRKKLAAKTKTTDRRKRRNR